MHVVFEDRLYQAHVYAHHFGSLMEARFLISREQCDEWLFTARYFFFVEHLSHALDCRGAIFTGHAVVDQNELVQILLIVCSSFHHLVRSYPVVARLKLDIKLFKQARDCNDVEGTIVADEHRGHITLSDSVLIIFAYFFNEHLKVISLRFSYGFILLRAFSRFSLDSGLVGKQHIRFVCVLDHHIIGYPSDREHCFT